MHQTRNCCWPVLLWWLSNLALRIAFGLKASQILQRQPLCQPGKVPSVLAVTHGNKGIPFETKCILPLLFAFIVRYCHCKIGYYCPEGSGTAVPCPRGMFAPSFWARDINGCISCPPHHYAATEGLASCLPCGSRAQQPLSGQDKCVCLSEGQVFQVSTYTSFLFIYANSIQ